MARAQALAHAEEEWQKVLNVVDVNDGPNVAPCVVCGRGPL